METYPIQRDYRWHTHIASYDAGRDRLLRPSNQLKLQQEVGELHFGEGGLGFAALYEHGMAFVLTRLNSIIHRAPTLGEPVVLETWHRDNRGVQFFRCYRFLDEAGSLLIESVSAFALVEVNTHKLLRPSRFDLFGVPRQPERTCGCPDPVKWRLPEQMRPAGEFLVGWSETDWNGHLNNTVYADLLCDYLPGGMNGRRITSFSIQYSAEAREGDVLTLRHGEQNGLLFVSGEHARGACFEARATVETI